MVFKEERKESMTYVKRKRFTRKPKDILLLALRNLWIGEELICTRKSYEAMMDRIKQITESFTERRYGIIRHGAIWKIWRTA
jgi:hypothetical protein